VHSSLPWAVDFGDGPRHPTQLYEIAFLMLLGLALALRARRPHFNGELFRLFIFGYLAFRFAIEFLKPRYAPWLGLSAIQVTTLVGMIACVIMLSRGDATAAAAARAAPQGVA
jgi:MYXO-CTERM domain-containing protein